MSDLVNPDEIEAIVGHAREEYAHWGRMSTVDKRFYILHSRRCKDSGIDLRQCPYSVALDQCFDPLDWEGLEDRPMPLELWHGNLMPDEEGLDQDTGATVVGPIMPDRKTD